jgi:hypothetical protein
MRWDSAAKGGPLGKSWGNYSINGYPFQKLFMIFQTRDFTPATLGWHIQSKNRVRQPRKHGSVRGVAGNGHPYRDATSVGPKKLEVLYILGVPIPLNV